MKTLRKCFLLPVLLLAGGLSVGVVPIFAQQSGLQVITEDHHDTSPPLRSLPQIPGAPNILHTVPLGQGRPPLATNQPDAVRQASMTGPLVSTTGSLSFDGILFTGYYPPDPNASVGATQVVETVNIEYAVYNKSTGALELGPAQIDSLWTGFGGACDPVSGSQVGDPVVVYDKLAGRWLISQIGLSGTTFYECVAVSTSSDATGSYNRYAFSFGSNLNDYPKFGVWPDAYYSSQNMFQNGATFIGAQPCAYNRSAMLAGTAATAICFQRSTSDWSLLPSDLDGLNPPPVGEPNFYLELSGSASLKLYKFHVDFVHPSNSTFTGPTTIAVAAFSDACGGNPGDCVPQPGTSTLLEALGDRLLYRLAYRNLNGVESLVANHSVTSGSSVGVRWYEIRKPNSTPVLNQQGTFAPDANYRWMGSIASDQADDFALGYSVSSSSLYPSIRYTGRVPGDAVGTMETENNVVAGSNSQSNASRWGDYTSMSVDPSDDCTFWYTGMYGAPGGSWTTHLVSFKFNSCPPPKQFVYTGSMNAARVSHTANLLESGLVLIAGGYSPSWYVDTSSAEIYNPSAGTFTYTGSLNTARAQHTGTLLVNGNVLVAGGAVGTSTALSSAELYDPSTSTFTLTGSLNTARYAHTATLLNSGLVLVTGGYTTGGTVALASAELYNPATATFTATGSMHTARLLHTATLLNNGMVLIAGGYNPSSGRLASAELYNPTTGVFTTVGNMTTSRQSQTATLLNDGTVLVAGGASDGTCGITCSTAELYNPTTKTFAATGSMVAGAYDRTATLLTSGLVLVAGGWGNSGPSTDAELYNPTTKTFSTTGSLNAKREEHTATLLNNGKVLVTGGDANPGILSSAELFQ